MRYIELDVLKNKCSKILLTIKDSKPALGTSRIQVFNMDRRRAESQTMFQFARTEGEERNEGDGETGMKTIINNTFPTGKNAIQQVKCNKKSFQQATETSNLAYLYCKIAPIA